MIDKKRNFSHKKLLIRRKRKYRSKKFIRMGSEKSVSSFWIFLIKWLSCKVLFLHAAIHFFYPRKLLLLGRTTKIRIVKLKKIVQFKICDFVWNIKFCSTTKHLLHTLHLNPLSVDIDWKEIIRINFTRNSVFSKILHTWFVK